MAVTGDYQFDLNGFTFGLGTSTSVTEISGLDMPEIDLTTVSRSFAHGAFTYGAFFKERVIAISGRVNGTLATMPGLRMALAKAFSPGASDVVFTFRLPGYANMEIGVKPQNLRGPMTNIATAVGWWDWIGTLVAGDPRIYASASQSVTPTLNGAASTATNGGNIPAPTTITFTGPLTDPKITNSTTGAAFGVTGTLASGEVWTASSLNNTVIKASNGASKYSTITTTAKTWVELAPGNNSLLATASAGTGTISVAWRDTYA